MDQFFRSLATDQGNHAVVSGLSGGVGVVLTLADVTELKKTERELRAASEQLSGELRRMARLNEVTPSG